MIVSILQLMGFPVGKPVHSRAEEPPPKKKPTKSRSGSGDPTDPSQERSARRQEVKTTSGKTSKAATAQDKPHATAKYKGKSDAKAAKPVAKQPVKAASKPVPKTAVAAKPVPRAAPKPVDKPAAKVSPTNTKKPVVKASPGPAPKAPALVKKPAAKAQMPAAKPTAKTVAPPISKPRAASSPDSMPVSTPSAKPTPTTVSSKSKSAVTPPPAVEKVIAAPVAVPAKAGRPSSRLAQLTVPSIAQTVASTAAKASYTQSIPSPLIVPALPSSIKKDPKLANNWKTTPAAQLSDAELMAMPDAEYMNTAQLAVFRLKLMKLKLDILNSAGETTEHLREDTSVVPDPADRATIEEEHALELRTRDRERKLLKKIEQSIGRIDAGDYGYCDETGEPIGVGRLLARPTATLSLEAQQRRELKQKMFGD